jgi:hypothetical protein
VPPSADQLLATVAVINAVAAAIALIIHALRVPYRESNAQEAVRATETGLKLRATYPPTETPPPGPEHTP